jgi:linoleoyl-CoA desaturase
MTAVKALKFAASYRDFAVTLNKRVGDYFQTAKISRHANGEMIVKTIVMFSLYLIPYFLIITSMVTGAWGLMGLVLIMGIGLAGIGLSVMHDANHGAYSDKRWINTALGYSLNFVGANVFNWKIQHNVLHHSFTNVEHEDEDIASRGVLRLSPHTKWKKMYQYQYLYAWFLYGFLTLAWMFAKDFLRFRRYEKNGLASKQNASITKEWSILIGTKIFYATYIIVIPIVVTALAWWQVLLGFFIMHYIAGFVLSIVFQPAHVIEGTSYPLPNEERFLETNWAAHQLLTTSNFGNGSRWFSWYVGGLNFQIEHHLFPNVCHVHYRHIAGIVKETALQFNLPYRGTTSFVAALLSHARFLKQLGRRPVPEPAPVS